MDAKPLFLAGSARLREHLCLEHAKRSNRRSLGRIRTGSICGRCARVGCGVRINECACDFHKPANPRAQIFRAVEFHFGTALCLKKIRAALVLR